MRRRAYQGKDNRQEDDDPGHVSNKEKRGSGDMNAWDLSSWQAGKREKR